jgi:hypothetical protein
VSVSGHPGEGLWDQASAEIAGHAVEAIALRASDREARRPVCEVALGRHQRDRDTIAREFVERQHELQCRDAAAGDHDLEWRIKT